MAELSPLKTTKTGRRPLEVDHSGHKDVASILVTGSTGFIGSHLVPRLRSSGHIVHEFSITLGTDVSDCRSFDMFADKRITHVIHLAGKTFVPESWYNPEQFYKVNTLGTQHLLDFCASAQARLIFVSSYLYGVPQYLPIDEQHPVAPNNPYAHSKWLAEELCRFYSAEMGTESIVLRPFNLYGPGQKRQFLIPELVMQALQGQEIVVKDAAPRRDYLHINDFVEVCVRALHYEHTPFQICNVGAGYSLSVQEIIETVIANCGKSLNWRSTGEIRQNEIPDTVADCSKISSLLGWTPKTSFHDGIYALMNGRQLT